jgi:PAS domain S-box-containing protein
MPVREPVLRFDLFDATPVGVFVLDSEFRIVFWNRCLENWTGLQASKLLGSDARPLFANLNSPAYSRRIQDVFKNGVPAVFSPQLHPPLVPCEIKPGVLRIQYVTVTSVRAEAGASSLAVFSIQDISDLTLRLQQSRKTAHELSVELKRRVELQNDLYRAKELAEAANQAKSRFLAMMSHEMRTPLHGVLGMGELLLHTDLSNDQREMVETMNSSGRLLLSLINDTLDLAKFDAGRLSLESVPFNLRTLAGESVRSLTPQATAKQLELRWNVDRRLPDRFQGDPTRIRQILVNLIGNAIKFTGRGSVELSIARDSSNPDAVRFVIADTGIGIDPEIQDRLFEPFVQADLSTTRRFGGTGLGLAICKSLVESMGGAIGVDSCLGEGSSFWFTIPLPVVAIAATPATHDRKTVSLSSAPAFRGRILIADDNMVNQRVTARMLERLGYSAQIVSNGLEAVDAIRTGEPFAAILMDGMMPVMDGYQATAEIRRLQGPGRYTPVIALTANTGTEGRLQSLDAGMDDFLPKPIDIRSMQEVLERVLASHAAVEAR